MLFRLFVFESADFLIGNAGPVTEPLLFHNSLRGEEEERGEVGNPIGTRYGSILGLSVDPQARPADALLFQGTLPTFPAVVHREADDLQRIAVEVGQLA